MCGGRSLPFARTSQLDWIWALRIDGILIQKAGRIATDWIKERHSSTSKHSERISEHTHCKELQCTAVQSPDMQPILGLPYNAQSAFASSNRLTQSPIPACIIWNFYDVAPKWVNVTMPILHVTVVYANFNLLNTSKCFVSSKIRIFVVVVNF